MKILLFLCPTNLNPYSWNILITKEMLQESITQQEENKYLNKCSFNINKLIFINVNLIKFQVLKSDFCITFRQKVEYTLIWGVFDIEKTNPYYWIYHFSSKCDTKKSDFIS